MKSFFIFRFFETPSFDDEDMQRLSKVLHGLFISIGVAILIGLIGVFFVFEEKFFSTIALAVLFTAALTASILSKYGYIRAASILLLTTIWLTSIGLVAMSGGMRSLDIILFITGTVLAGLLLGQHGTIYYGGASVFAGIVLLVLDTLGVTLPNLFPFPAQTGLVLLLINLAILTPALNTTLNTLHHAIEEASLKIRKQKKIQKELQISEEKFSKAFHASPMAIVIQRVRDLKYFDVNESFTRITGYSREVAQEHTINELNLYPDKQISLKLGKQVREQGFVRDFETPFRRKNGDIGYDLVRGNPSISMAKPCISMALLTSRDARNWRFCNLNRRRRYPFSMERFQNLPVNPIM